jgi:hypothetical protein
MSIECRGVGRKGVARLAEKGILVEERKVGGNS